MLAVFYASHPDAPTGGINIWVYLIGIAVGSYRSRVYFDGQSEGREAQERALGRFLFLANAVAFLAAPAMGLCVTVAPWPVSLALVVVATALTGAILPLVSHLAILPDDRAGQWPDRVRLVHRGRDLGPGRGGVLGGQGGPGQLR